jgi:hypothetical protein
MTTEVAASEADLIQLARALVAPADHDIRLLVGKRRTLPPHIGPSCAELLGDTLRQLWPALWRRDGARPGTTIVDGKPIRGRGWERHAPAALVHTKATLEILRWLLLSDDTKLQQRELAIGDQVVVYLALDALAAAKVPSNFVSQPLVRACPLAWLGFAGWTVHLIKDEPPSFDSLVEGAGAIVVETLSLDIARRWHQVEVGKRSLTEPDVLAVLGAAQDAVLQRFMATCDRAKRRDLAGFVLDVAAPLLAGRVAPIPVALDPDEPLAVRMRARHAAGALLRGVVTWCEWDEQHRGVRFIDDGYASAQVLLSRFEKIGRAGADLAAAWISELAALPASPTSATIPTG